MFKRKPKKSHKNDEIYIDYSKDVDVKKIDEDEAKPEHYKALEVEDEVVVSTIQIKEAIQQKAQEEFIEQRKREAAREQRVKEEQEAYIDKEKDLLNSKSQEESSIEKEMVEENQIEVDPIEDVQLVKKADEQEVEDMNEEPINKQQVQDAQTRDDIDPYIETPSKEESLQVEEIDDIQDQLEDDEIDTEEEDRNDHPIYPSFLHEELSVRRNLEPIKRKSTEDEQTLDDTDDSLQEIEEDSVELTDEQIEMNEDAQQEDSTQLHVSEEKKQDLNSYFQTDASVLKKGARKQQKIEDKENLEDRRIPLYQYKDHKFYSVKEFLTFLESNYSQLDHIAQDILKDEQFFRWIKEESNQFEESITKMRKFKHELKQ